MLSKEDGTNHKCCLQQIAQVLSSEDSKNAVFRRKHKCCLPKIAQIMSTGDEKKAKMLSSEYSTNDDYR